jgi:hypothetical protein
MARPEFRASGNVPAESGKQSKQRGVSVVSEIVKTNPDDGFEGFEGRSKGDEGSRGRGVIQGTCVKFTNEAVWVNNDDEELPADLELVVVNIGRVVQKWKDQQPIETRVLEPGEKFPDLDKLNEDTPRREWVEGPDGNKRGPWQAQYLVYMLSPETMDRYTWPTGTVGGSIAVRDLVDKTKWMRRLRGAHVYPVVTLSDRFMNTRFGGRQRPHLVVKRWIAFDADQKALPTPATSANPKQLEKLATETTPATAAGVRTVDTPPLAEELNDEIPSKGDASKRDRKRGRKSSRKSVLAPPA